MLSDVNMFRLPIKIWSPTFDTEQMENQDKHVTMGLTFWDVLFLQSRKILYTLCMYSKCFWIVYLIKHPFLHIIKVPNFIIFELISDTHV